MRLFFVGMALAGASILAGCSNIPPDTLRTYADAFQQARDAGDLLYDEISPIVSGATSSGSGHKCGTSPLGYPLCFDPASALDAADIRSNEDPSITARRDALATVAIYNAMLVDMAEGRTAQAVGARIDTLVTLANAVAALGVVPSGGLSALIPAGAVFARDLAVRLETARSSGLVRQSILDSKDDIQELLSALADDTPQIYAVFRTAREKELFNLRADRKIAQLSKDTAAEARANARSKAVLESISVFHESLTAYVRLLDTTSQALDALVVAASQGPDAVSQAAIVVQEAADIRAKAGTFWAKIREVRTTAAGGR